jgi:hypothetical protein
MSFLEMVKVSCPKPKAVRENVPMMIIKLMFLIMIVLDYGAKIYGQYFLFSNKCYIDG